MKKNNTATSLTILAIILFVLFGINTNFAKALTLSPARIEVSGDPGTVVNKEITLSNDNKTTSETYYVSFANFEAQGETGSPLFVEPKSDLGTWMNTIQTITLAPGQSKTIPLSITIPKDAYAGGHFAAVFFGNNPNTPNDGQVSVGAKIGTLVLLSVNGNVLEAGGLVGFNTLNHKFFYNSLPVDFEYRWKNDGNDRVKPEGTLTIHDMVYIPVDHINANAVSGNILPHSTRLFNLEWLKQKADATVTSSFFSQVAYQWHNFAIGPYFARLDLVYGLQNIHSKKTVLFFVFPWQLLLCIIIILIIVFFVGKKLLKRYNSYIIKKAQVGTNTPVSNSNNG